MKTLEFLITVPDKYNGTVYEAGKRYDFLLDRADEILQARTPVTNEPYAKLVETVEKPVGTIYKDEMPKIKVTEKPKRKRKTKQD